MSNPPNVSPKPTFSCYPGGIPPTLAWTWTGTMMDEHIMAGGNRVDVCPGVRAEVTTPSGDRFNIYALGNMSRGNMHAAESRLHKEGGAENWCKNSGGTVSMPCVNKFQDGGDAVFMVVAHPVKTAQPIKRVYLKQEIYDDIVGLNSAPMEPPCTCENVNLPHSSDCPWKQWKDKK